MAADLCAEAATGTKSGVDDGGAVFAARGAGNPGRGRCRSCYIKRIHLAAGRRFPLKQGAGFRAIITEGSSAASSAVIMPSAFAYSWDRPL